MSEDDQNCPSARLVSKFLIGNGNPDAEEENWIPAGVCSVLID
jgi:hypothetical protein